jgi:hypothetical protein
VEAGGGASLCRLFNFMKKLLFLFICFFLNTANAVSLHKKQAAFSQLLAKLIIHANSLGYEVTLGEAWRSQVVAKYLPTKWYADHGMGIADSLHVLRLAIDINLFKDGVFLTKPDDYAPLGEWWEKQSDLSNGIKCAWGGRFKKLKDANHFSLENGGIQ